MDRGTGGLQTQPRADIGFVVGVGEDDLIARAHLRQDGLDQLEHQRRGGPAHHHLLVVAGVDQARNRLARLQDLGTRFLRMDITGAQLHAAAQQVVAHPVRHPAQHLRATGVIQKHKVLRKRRKFAADSGQIQRGRRSGNRHRRISVL